MDLKFLPGLELNEGFYIDVIRPILQSHFPNIEYSAGLIGYGSDVLGFDTPISMDHNWGPRVIIFLSEEDFTKYKSEIDNCFKTNLPNEYIGFPTNFSNPKSDGVQSMEWSETGEVNHLITITTIRDFLNESVGVTSIEGIKTKDWLKFSNQGLIEITKGKVFHDGLNKLNFIRDFFRFLPEDILKLKLAALWNYISNEEAFIGRNRDIGENIGARLISTRIINALMKICFYLEKEYIPYSKWITKAFRNLKCYNTMSKLFSDTVNCTDIDRLDEKVSQACVAVSDYQNELGISKDNQIKAVSYHGRPYLVIMAEEISNHLIDMISDKSIAKIKLDLLSIIENIDGIDLTNNKELLSSVFN